MPKFKVRFCLDDEPDKVVAEYIIETQFEDDAIAQANVRWREDFPEESRKPFMSGCGYA